LPVCRSIMYAPPKSSLKKVSIATVGQLLIHLTDARNLQNKDESQATVPHPHYELSLVSFIIRALSQKCVQKLT
jgi:hypothetical protein